MLFSDRFVFLTGKKVCPDGHFSCQNGVCLPPTWVCDGSPDCAGGDDEDKDKCSECLSHCNPVQFFLYPLT